MDKRVKVLEMLGEREKAILYKLKSELEEMGEEKFLKAINEVPFVCLNCLTFRHVAMSGNAYITVRSDGVYVEDFDVDWIVCEGCGNDDIAAVVELFDINDVSQLVEVLKELK